MASGEHERGGSPVPSRSDEELDRIVSAFFHNAAQRGYRGVSLERVAREAEVPLASVEARFSTKEELLLVAKKEFVSQLWIEVSAAFHEQEEWPSQVKAGLHAAVSYVVDASSLARFFMVEANLVSLAAAERHATNVDRFGALLRDGRERDRQAAALPAVTEDLLVGGVASILVTHLRAEDPAALAALEPEILEMLLIPYLGADEARRIAGR